MLYYNCVENYLLNNHHKINQRNEKMYTLNINDDQLIKNVCVAAFPGYNGRKVQINYNCKSVNMRSYWDEGSKSDFVVLRLQDNKALNVPPGHPVFNHISGVDNFSIPENFVVVEHIIFCGKDLGLRIHTPRTAPLLNDGNNPELTRVQTMVLSWITGLTSAGRKYEIENNHFPIKLFNAICRELESMELVKINKVGVTQATNKAKNLINNASQNFDSYSWWSKMYNWETRKYTGEAKQILIEYNQKYNLFK
jgi:hypothetical protein